MCETCGCGVGDVSLTDLSTGKTEHVHAPAASPQGHFHADGTYHEHQHRGEHSHERSVVEVGARILAKNDELAARNRAWLAGREILALNLMSAPGAGKTTLLERTIPLLGKGVFVLEGDQATDNDGARVEATGASAVQINTGSGCHLDAEMVARGVKLLRPAPGSVLFIENVGNLVCPALFDLGEAKRVAVLSVTEGDDKPEKYPHMFRAADLVVLNKMDLLPHVDFDVARATDHARALNPAVEIITLSARTGEGLEAWRAWIETCRASMRDEVFAIHR